MTNNSDSDSESESEAQALGLPLYSHEIGLSETDLGDVKAAVETLMRINIHDVPQGNHLYDDILKASNAIIGFLDDPLSGAMTDEAIFLGTFIELVSIPFLSTLFRYRTVFHNIGTQARVPGTLSSTVVCWVDVVFAKLGEAVVKVAGGLFQTNSSQQPMPESLRKQREEDDVRAAAQLPQSWGSVPGVISLDNASPAAKRLALRLTFAVYVMGPQFVDSDPWNDGGVPPCEMVTTLQTRVTQISCTGSLERRSASDHFYQQERISHAMTVSLFAIADSMQRKAGDVGPLSPFRPRSLTSLMQLIQFVMHINDVPSENIVFSCDDLDIAQIIMVRWGETVPWCWTVWDDQRIANVESITVLTTMWLRQLGVSLFKPTVDQSPEAWTTELAPLLVKYRSASCSAMLQVLYRSMLALCSSSPPIHLSYPSIDILTKSCWATVQILNSRVINGSNASPFYLELCKCLCGLFVLLDHDGHLQIKYFIIEALCLIDADTIRLGVKGIQEDTKIYFATKLEEAIANSKRMIFDRTGQFSTKEADFLAGKLVLEFLAVLWHSKSRGYFYPQSISSLLFALVDRLPREQQNSLASRFLRDSLITALSSLEVVRSDPAFSGINKVWADETLWELAIMSRRSDLVAASAFSHYTLATDSLCNPLNCAEAWDYLRDVLLLILSGRFLGDEEPLALIICPVICHALLRLVREVGWQAARFIMSSPWTTSLCADLKGLLNDGSQQTQYSLVLKGRLNSVGRALLDQINHKLNPAVAGPRVEIPNIDLCPLFCHLSPVPRLLLVPR